MKDFMDKMDGKITKKKMEKALDMLRSSSTADLKKKFDNVDVNEIMKKLNKYDMQKMKELGIDMSDIKGRLTDSDIQKITNVLGRDGEAVMRKIRDILR